MGAGIDSSDNVYSSGYSDVSGFRNAYVVKHDSSGALQWQRRLQGSGGGDLFGNLCAVDTSGNVYVLCYDVNAPGYLIIAKWDSSGTIQWQRSLVINNIFTSSADIKVSGNTIIVTGNYSQASILYNSSYVIKVPTDGSKTGTYTVGGHTYTYSAANNSETYGSMSEASDSLTLNVASISTSTTSATVESSSLVAAVTNI